ncbi:MAG: DNA helicase [Pseudomonadota bacterium]
MRLSAPIYALKRQAKLLARQTDIPLHQALDRIAGEAGFQNWSHLASSFKSQSPARDVLAQLAAGDLVLIAARPGHGKTLLGLELASRAAQFGRQGYFFTLEAHERDVEDYLSSLGIGPGSTDEVVVIDTSDEVSADYITARLAPEPGPALIVVDYLQILDQKRANPSLNDQIDALKTYVADTGAICALISQIDRAFDLSGKAMPDISDVRLPNPLDLSAFSKSFFLHNGMVQLAQTA